MSWSRRFIAYFCLVVAPLCGIAAILHFGRDLSAPLSVNGSWRLEGDFSRLAGKPCGNSLSGPLDISQSGTHLTLGFAGSRRPATTGRLAGNRLTATVCQDAGGALLAATISGTGAGRRLEGSFTLSDCTGCEPLPFQAVRLPSAGARRGGH